ncbi:YeeE/YedE family protein [Azospirillum baldaniorum]|uniref:Sulphur transport domain-containing protein n=1 Tax=Azospirillum baldaniorum TaxID=1064539 RepID=A0A9P1JQ89_9PROT|nr:YeeE/YedE thiosulfate transporter family protein [Azospirillum baldaniorum]AWJ90244.1 YeeE/YedE family protein [Azospirillum baldaniorum]TWA77204.1 hypothetical protein FBZ85_10771 [Azospirillum brasilense]CCC97676.1 conserved membrane protein of unknown function [Azospirillum baldaniorum]
MTIRTRNGEPALRASPTLHAAPAPASSATALAGRVLLPLLLAGAVVAAAYALAAQPGGGPSLAFALTLGAAFGALLQRTRFCFLCHARDFIDRRDPRGLLAILLALAVGTVGYHVVFGAWVPNPVAPRLPPDAHIGPVSWVLALAGLAFGLGMAVSGSCFSAHLYRLGEGSPVSSFALVGAAGGFLLGFLTWNDLYLSTIITAPVVWLPHHLGYGGSLAAQLLALGGLAALLWRFRAASASEAPAREPPHTLLDLLRSWFDGRWPYWIGGLGVGLIGFLVILRLKPLGVTSAIGSAARQLGSEAGLVPLRLEGLDGFAGCATVPGDSWLTPNGLLVAGLVAGGFAASLAAGQFTPRRPTLRDAARGLGGGLLLGWGSMTGLGCTVGTLLSGTMAGALSGWVFGLTVLVGVWAGLALPRRIVRR